MNKTAIKKKFNLNFKSNRKTNKEEFTFGLRKTYLFMLFLISTLFIYYVWILNVNATKWYNIRELELEKRALLLEKELLDVKISELESLDSIRNPKNIENLDMQLVEEHTFIVIKDDVQYVFNNK